jgi:hypothetical protein
MVIVFASFGDDSVPPTHEWDKYLYLVNLVTRLLFSSAFCHSIGLRAWLRSLAHHHKIKFSLVAIACLGHLVCDPLEHFRPASRL